MRKIPVIFCIDVEPDEREIDVTSPGDWKGFEETFKLFTYFRPHLEKATGAPVNFSWFFRMDPQIKLAYGQPGWVVERYGAAIKRLEQAGDEIGLHTHAWRWDESLHKWVIDHGDQKWIDHCLDMSFEAFQSAFARPCLCFRFGDHWMNNETMNSLASMGVKFDLTVEPGRRARPSLCDSESHTGSLPDYTRAPRWPYRPSRQDFRAQSREHRGGLWEIPLSTGKEPGRLAKLKKVAKAFRVDLQRRHEEVPLNPCIRAPGFRAMMDSLLEVRKRLYLALVLRTEACIRPGSTAIVEQNLNFILSHPMVSDFQFVRPAEAIKLLIHAIPQGAELDSRYGSLLTPGPIATVESALDA